MTDQLRPLPAYETQLRQRITAEQTDIPVITTAGFVVGARKLVGDEFVQCASFGVDALGHPVMQSCRRGAGREDGGSEPRPWPGGTPVSEVAWTAIDIVTEIPVPTRDMAGRQFQYQDENGDLYTFNVVAVVGGEPYIDWVNEPPGGETAVTLALQPRFTGTNAFAVAVDASGNTYYGRGTNLRKLNSSGVQQWSVTVTGADISGLATDGTNVYVSGGLSTDVIYRRLCSTGAAASPASFGSSGSGNGQFNAPYGLCTNGTHIWVADFFNHRIQKFTVGGAYVSQFGSVGSGDGQFQQPLGIALDAAGNIFVAEFFTDRVQVFSPSHVHQLSFGSEGHADGQLSGPVGIAVDTAGIIWVADQRNHRLQVFSDDGTFLAKIGSFGSGSAQLKYPSHLAIDANDVVLVADRDNTRLSAARLVPEGITPAITVRTNSVNVGNTSTNCVTATCNPGEVLTGGGCDYIAGPNFWLGRCAHTGSNSWECCARNNSSGGGQTLTAQVICMAIPLTED